MICKEQCLKLPSLTKIEMVCFAIMILLKNLTKEMSVRLNKFKKEGTKVGFESH